MGGQKDEFDTIARCQRIVVPLTVHPLASEFAKALLHLGKRQHSYSGAPGQNDFLNLPGQVCFQPFELLLVLFI